MEDRLPAIRQPGSDLGRQGTLAWRNKFVKQAGSLLAEPGLSLDESVHRAKRLRNP